MLLIKLPPSPLSLIRIRTHPIKLSSYCYHNTQLKINLSKYYTPHLPLCTRNALTTSLEDAFELRIDNGSLGMPTFGFYAAAAI